MIVSIPLLIKPNTKHYHSNYPLLHPLSSAHQKFHNFYNKKIVLMPPNSDDKGREVSTPDSDLSIAVQNEDLASTSSASELTPDDQSVSESIDLPEELTLKELVQRSCNCNDVSDVTKVTLSVIAADVSLQHLSRHTPMLSELTLDGSSLASLRDLGCSLKHLKILRVNRCGLVNLDGSYGFDNLEELYLAQNKLTDISQCSNFPHLKIVDATKNSLVQIDSLYFLSLCDGLKELTVKENDDIVSTPDYRKTIKELIPQLMVLDGKPFTSEECRLKGKNNAIVPGPSFLPPLEKPKGPQSASNSSFAVPFPPKVLSLSGSQRPTSSLPCVRTGPQRDINVNRVLPGIKNRLGSAQR